MAIEVKTNKLKKTKTQLHAEIKEKYGNKKRDPEKALDEMYGLWEGRDISIEQIREKNNKNKWF